ncbi:hypothetical protein B0J17DRAFT_729741 [Rhizoctonia solani]|nr:hypothetical protein B0J17DRAFT_729741 [Rhizoctonia solani]
MSLPGALLDLLLEAYHQVEIAKNLALASVTFFVYDLLITIGPEIRHVWTSKWGYGRIAFHFNRIWSIIVLGELLITVNHARCHRVITFYGYGVILLIFNTTKLGYYMTASFALSSRAADSFHRSPLVLAGLIFCSVGGAIACMVIFQLDVNRMTIIPNPVPSLITGCLTILPRRVTLVPYLIGLSLDTAIFLATWHRTWVLNRTGVRLPIIQCLLRDTDNEAKWPILLCIDEKINNIALGSGYIVALHSTLCNRILLSLRVFNDELKSSVSVSGIGTRTGSTTLHDMEWRPAGDGDYQSTNVRTDMDLQDCERQDPPLELAELRRP